MCGGGGSGGGGGGGWSGYSGGATGPGGMGYGLSNSGGGNNGNGSGTGYGGYGGDGTLGGMPGVSVNAPGDSGQGTISADNNGGGSGGSNQGSGTLDGVSVNSPTDDGQGGIPADIGGSSVNWGQAGKLALSTFTTVSGLTANPLAGGTAALAAFLASVGLQGGFEGNGANATQSMDGGNQTGFSGPTVSNLGVDTTDRSADSGSGGGDGESDAGQDTTNGPLPGDLGDIAEDDQRRRQGFGYLEAISGEGDYDLSMLWNPNVQTRGRNSAYLY